MPCFREDPDDSTKHYFFNQVHLQYPHKVLRGGLFNHLMANLLYCRDHTKQYDVKFKNGKIDSALLGRIYKILDENTILFNWQERDCLFVDNIRTMHGRNKYEGPRKILAALVQ